jgi:hypothetical protein
MPKLSIHGSFYHFSDVADRPRLKSFLLAFGSRGGKAIITSFNHEEGKETAK